MYVVNADTRERWQLEAARLREMDEVTLRNERDLAVKQAAEAEARLEAAEAKAKEVETKAEGAEVKAAKAEGEVGALKEQLRQLQEEAARK